MCYTNNTALPRQIHIVLPRSRNAEGVQGWRGNEGVFFPPHSISIVLSRNESCASHLNPGAASAAGRLGVCIGKGYVS